MNRSPYATRSPLDRWAGFVAGLIVLGGIVVGVVLGAEHVAAFVTSFQHLTDQSGQWLSSALS